MIKALGRFFLKTMLVGWIFGLAMVVFSFPLLKMVHGELYSLLWVTPVEALNDAPVYRLVENRFLSQQGFLIGRGEEPAIKYISPYKGVAANADYINDMSWGQAGWLAALSWLHPEAGEVISSDKHLFWKPASFNYKTLVVRSESGTFVDEVGQQFQTDSDVFFDRIMTGFIDVPLDPFGGAFLFYEDVPEILTTELTGSSVYTVANFDNEARLFISEAWAVDNQNWAVTPLVVLVLAGLLTAIPWWVFPKAPVIWPWVVAFLVVSSVLLVTLLRYFQFAYPVVSPIVSLLIAWLWFGGLNKHRAVLASLSFRYLALNQLWINHLLDEGKPEAAYRYLSDPENQASDASLWVLVAQGFERARVFDKAISCYEVILVSDSRHKLAKKKLKQLNSVTDATKTVSMMPHSAELPVGKVQDLRLGRYKITSEVGRGAMGVVYEAIDPKIDRKVALKVVNLKNLGIDEVDQVKQRFFREAQAAGKLNHPNIVTVYDVGEEHDVAYIAMDFLVGQPLAQHNLKRPIDLLKMVTWMAEAADALAYAHQYDVVHRDVKPANMIIEEKSNRLQLTDFGVARVAGFQQTQTGVVLGSPSYMSPEQIRGEKLTGQTDIFSLGVTLYQCITGELPFVGDTLPTLAYAITQSKQESPRTLNPEVPLSLVRIVNKALQKMPEDRYAKASDFAASLHKWVNEF